jgi:hypothetical protein
MSISQNGDNLGNGGQIASSAFPIAYVLGGLNTWGNPDLYLPSTVNNGVCQIPSGKQNVLLGIYEPVLSVCRITFAAQTTLVKRGLDPNDANNWIIESERRPFYG